MHEIHTIKIKKTVATAIATEATMRRISLFEPTPVALDGSSVVVVFADIRIRQFYNMQFN